MRSVGCRRFICIVRDRPVLGITVEDRTSVATGDIGAKYSLDTRLDEQSDGMWTVYRAIPFADRVILPDGLRFEVRMSRGERCRVEPLEANCSLHNRGRRRTN